MKTFQDSAGRTWHVTVDVNAVKRVMKAQFEWMGEPLKVNLLSLVEPESDLLKKVLDYPPLLCDITYAICQPQCLEKGVSDEEFGRAMLGDVLEKALDCILEETVDFFPQHRRTILRKVLEKTRAFAAKATELTAALVANGELDAALDAVLGPELAKLQTPSEPAPTTGTGTVGSWPASSASTPVPTPSGS